MSHSFSLPLSNYQSSYIFLLIPSQLLGSDEVYDSQPSGSLSQPHEPSSCHNPIQRWIEHSCGNKTWHNLAPRSYLHELDFMIAYDTMITLTHDLFVLDLSLCWFVMKHIGKYFDALLRWFHWLHDYTYRFSIV
jgi:hypothetical protein